MKPKIMKKYHDEVSWYECNEQMVIHSCEDKGYYAAGTSLSELYRSGSVITPWAEFKIDNNQKSSYESL